MKRSHSLLATAAIALGAASPATAAVIAPAGTNAHEVTVAAGPDGRAVLTWVADGKRVQISELSPGSGFGPATQVFEAPNAGSIAFGALGPDRLVVLAQRGSAGLPTEAVAVQRANGASAFGAPTTIASSEQYAEIVDVASNARGDVAAAIRTSSQRVVLVTAPRGGSFGAPQAIGRPGDRFYQAAVAVGLGGQLVVAYYDGRSRAYVQQGVVSAALGPPQLLSRARNYPVFHAAIDGRGNATVAFERNRGRREFEIVAARARAGHGFGPARVLTHTSNVRVSAIAAARGTTALAWDDLTSSSGVRVAIAHDSGRFGRAVDPAARPFKLHGEAGRSPSQANSVRLAVDSRGDVLAAYPYGPFASVHVAMLLAGHHAFGAPRVVSSLGREGYPQVVLTTDRRPVIAWTTADGAVLATTSAHGDRVSYHPPRPSLSEIDDSALATDGVVTTKLRCSTDCAFNTSARITTGRGRGQVITRRYVGERVLHAGHALTLRFELKQGGAEAFQRTGRAQVKVIITAANASGASYTVRRVLERGRRTRG